jgi:single-stranded-DNA-specific exonuclease
MEGFKREFLSHLEGSLTEDDFMPEVSIDAVVPLKDVGMRLVAEIQSLAPFGVANREPLLCLTGAEIVKTEIVGARHLRFRVRQNGGEWQHGIGFGLAGLHPVTGDGFNVAFSPYVDEWQGVRSVRLKIKEVELSRDAMIVPLATDKAVHGQA